MPLQFAWLIAVISSALCLFFWFRDVRRIIGKKRSTVESTWRQLVFSRKRGGLCAPPRRRCWSEARASTVRRWTITAGRCASRGSIRWRP